MFIEFVGFLGFIGLMKQGCAENWILITRDYSTNTTNSKNPINKSEGFEESRIQGSEGSREPSAEST